MTTGTAAIVLPAIPTEVDTPNCPRPGSRTPWGPAQQVISVQGLPGARWVSTAGHGGLWLAPAVVQLMPAEYKKPSMFYPTQGPEGAQP